MFDTLKSLAALFLSYGLFLTANGLFTTLLGVRTAIERFPTELTGVVMASYFCGLLLGARYAVRVVSIAGHIRSFALFASVMSITALVHVLVINPPTWMAARMVSGFCMAGLVMVTESWFNARAPTAVRGRILSLYMGTTYLAGGLAQFLLPFADPSRFHLFSAVSIIFSLALVPVLVTRAPAPPPSEPVAVDMRELFRVSPVGVTGAFIAGLANSSFYAMGPVYARNIGLDVAQISLFMAAGIFCGLLLQWPMGRLSDRVDRRLVIIAAGACTGIACIALVAAPVEFFVLQCILIGCYGSFAFTIYSLSCAHTNDQARPDRLVQTASGLLTAYGVGAVCGPLFAALTMGQLGDRGLFVTNTAAAVCLVAFTIARIKRRAPVPGHRKERFVPMPQTPTAKELYAAMRNTRDRDMARLIGGVRRH